MGSFACKLYVILGILLFCVFHSRRILRTKYIFLLSIVRKHPAKTAMRIARFLYINAFSNFQIRKLSFLCKNQEHAIILK